MPSDPEEFRGQPHTAGRGRSAEAAAVAWLEGRGYRVVERNVTTRAGEIDLVARDGDALCFVEIKARLDSRFGPAVAAVGPGKRRRLARAAALYLARSGWRGECRFDVLGLEAEGPAWRYELIRGAFDASGR